MVLSSNCDLYDYLLLLSAGLKARGAARPGDVLARAARSASGLSTEFLGESRIALADLLREYSGNLTNTERDDVQSVIRQISDALETR